MFSGQQDQKKKGVKQGVDVANAARRRQDMGISLRDKRREETLQKKRNTGPQQEGGAQNAQPPAPNEMITDPMACDVNTRCELISLALLPAFVQMVKSNDPRYQLHGTMMIRKFLAVEQQPPVQDIINHPSMVCVDFANFLFRDDFQELQFEACWALSNIASGRPDETEYVVRINALPGFIHLLSSPDERCREQAAWGLGNVAGEGAQCRDFALSLNVLPPLLNLINSNENKNPTTLSNATWALSNLCRGKPLPPLSAVAEAVPVLASLLNRTEDSVVADACWALSYISDGPPERVEACLETGILPRVIRLLNAGDSKLQMPAIRIVGNVATGTDEQTQSLINLGALPPMHFLLQHKKRSIRKETCWTISNIAAGTTDQIQALIVSNLFPEIIKALKSAEYEVRKEAIWTIANAVNGGTDQQIEYLAQNLAVENLCEQLTLTDPRIVLVALEALEGFLSNGKKLQEFGRPNNRYAVLLEECGGIDKLEALEDSQSSEVYNRVATLLETYFETEELTEQTVDDLQPGVTATQSGYNFGQQGQQGGGNYNF